MKYLQDDRLSAITARLLTPDLADLARGASSSALLSGRLGGPRGAFAAASSGRRVRGKIEAYTTKRTSTDKKYASSLGIKYVTSLQRHNNSVEVMQQQQHLQQQRHSVVFPLLRQHTDAAHQLVVGADNSPPRASERKRRSHSVGFQGDMTSSSHNKKPRSRSNSLDDNVLSCHTALGDFAAQETRRLMTDFVLTLNMSFPDYDFEEVSPNDFEKVPLGQVVRHVQSLLLTDSTSSTAATVVAAPPPGPAAPTLSSLAQELEGTTTSTGIAGPAPELQGSMAAASDVRYGDYGDGSVSEFAYEAASSTTDPISAQAPDVGRTGGLGGGGSSDLLTELWSAMDGAIRLGECEVYRWTNPPEGLLSDSDFLDDLGGEEGDNGGTLSSSTDDAVTVWSFYYLFVNKSLKRIVFFCCSETLVNRHAAGAASNEASYMDDEDFIGRVPGDGALQDVDLVSEQDIGDDDDDDDEDGIVTSSQHYKMMMSSADASSSEADFDLDPAAVAAGGIPISTI